MATTKEPIASDLGELGNGLPSTGLLSFYDRLRERIRAFIDRRGTRLGEGVAEALLLVPDVFMLLLRLALDREVPSSTRALIGGALAYIVVPLDLLPEGFVGAGGFVEDLVLAVVVLSAVMGPELEAKAEQYWSGSEGIRKVITDIVGAADSLLGIDLSARVRGFLARRGIEMEALEEAE